MAGGMLDEKLHELKSKIDAVYVRIEKTGEADHDQIKAELETVRKECAEGELALRRKLQESKSAVIMKFADAYDEMRAFVNRAEEEAGVMEGSDFAEGLDADEKLLFAEYALDFAVQSAYRALLTAYEAIDALMTEEEKEGSI